MSESLSTVQTALLKGMNMLLFDKTGLTAEEGQALAAMADAFVRAYRTQKEIVI